MLFCPRLNLWRKSRGTKRCLSSSSKAAAATTTNAIVELRKMQFYPAGTSIYTQSINDAGPLLQKHLPLAFAGLPETGAIELDTAVHLYYYGDGHADRLAKQAAMALDLNMMQYVGDVEACLLRQSSEIYVEASIVKDFDEITGLKYWPSLEANNDRSGDNYVDDSGSTRSSSAIVELRKYQLRLGYDTVPKFLSFYSEALPYKLKALGTHPTTQLVTILNAEIGSLNTVYEVWKHGGKIPGHEDSTDYCGYSALEMSRQASRGVMEWRNGIAQIAELAVTFDTTILKPMECSPLQ